MSTYDAEKSSATTATIGDFCRRADLSECAIDNCPGIGPAGAEKLSDEGINKIGQLVGWFLVGDNGARNTQQVCQTFYNKLINDWNMSKAHSHSITFCVCNLCAEKGLFEYDN